MPIISVIVPVYKVEPYIHRCIDSILSQTFVDFELILIDDGSPDNCPDICDEYALKDNKIHVIHQKNSGLSVARNAGLDYVSSSSNSEWITFVDSDDWIDKHYLEYLYKAANESNTNISSCVYRIINDNNYNQETRTTKYRCDIYTPEKYYIDNRVNAVVAWGKLYKKQLFCSLRYPAGKINEDEFVTYRLLFNETEVSVVDVNLYMYYQNPNGIMNSDWSVRRLDVLDAFEEQISFFYKNSFFVAYDHALKRYAVSLMTNLIRLREKKESNIYEKKIIRKLRSLLIKKSYVLKNEKYYLWYLDTAFPNLMRFYWIIKNKCKSISKQ